MPRIVFFTDLEWALGTIHRELAEEFRQAGWTADLVSWATRPDPSAFVQADVVMTLPGTPSHALTTQLGVPYERVFAVAHAESDLQTILGLEPNGLQSYGGYAVTSDSLVASSLALGITRVPGVLRLGIRTSRFLNTPLPTKLERVGYTSVMSRKTTSGVEQKRGHLAQAAAEAAGLEFVYPDRVGIDAVPALYAGFDALIMSSLMEGSPVPPLEAAASGRLVIGTPAGHFPRLVTEGIGILAPLGEREFVAWTINLLRYYKQRPDVFLHDCAKNREAVQIRDWSRIFPDWLIFVDGTAKPQGIAVDQEPSAAGPAQPAAHSSPVVAVARERRPEGPAMHFICPFHTVPDPVASHCAFTGKALRFPKMMQGYFGGGYYEYANAGSTSLAEHKVEILSAAQCREFYPRKAKDFWGNHANINSDGWRAFDKKLREELQKRVHPGDFIGHPFGLAHYALVRDFPPPVIHVETGIGYPDSPSGAFRIFESWAWAHFHWGKYEKGFEGDGMNRVYSWVIPNYYDLADWDVRLRPAKADGEGYILFAGRIDPGKGSDVLGTIIKAWFQKYPKSKLRFRYVGQGDFKPLRQHIGREAMKHVDYDGPIHGRERSKVYGNATAMVMPTGFIEPFGGSGVEGQLCGTPLLGSAYGAFTETITPGVNGYVCRTLGDWIDAIGRAKKLDRKTVATMSRARYSLEACRVKYERAFDALTELAWGRGAMNPDFSSLQLVP